MLWDLPSERQKKKQKEKAPIYVSYRFIKNKSIFLAEIGYLVILIINISLKFKNIFQAVFIKRLSQRRKMQRLRQKGKERKELPLVVEVVKDKVEVSPEDAVSELKVLSLLLFTFTFNLNCLILD
jgi:hypothetical protein